MKSHISPHINPLLLVLDEDTAGEDLLDLLVMDMTTPSNTMAEVASEAYLKEEAAVFMVALENLANLIKAKPNSVLGSPLDQFIKTRTVALNVTNPAIIWPNVLNMRLPQLIHLKKYILLLYDESTTNSSCPVAYNYMTDGEEGQHMTEYLNA